MEKSSLNWKNKKKQRIQNNSKRTALLKWLFEFAAWYHVFTMKMCYCRRHMYLFVFFCVLYEWLFNSRKCSFQSFKEHKSAAIQLFFHYRSVIYINHDWEESSSELIRLRRKWRKSMRKNCSWIDINLKRSDV